MRAFKSSTVVPAALLAGLAALAPPPARAADATLGAEALQSRHAELRPRLAQSPFGRPLLVESNDSASAPLGQVWAVLDKPFEAVAEALREPRHWCDILMLQTNVKRCAPSGSGERQQLEVGIARRYTDPVEQAQALAFNFSAAPPQPGWLSVALSAAQGPVGTQNYQLRFQAVPVGPQRTFMHLSYAYETGLAARLATSAYLASAGKDKVGFTITGRDEQGRPQYVRGMQGVAERNTMRYFLAIDTFLATAGAPLETRLRGFHAALERYPAQLRETEQGEYLAMKQREVQAR
ncbi:hypothetical protein [Azohydromonas aeria]|uniref:hypothetical protein n=1 Tax=Azohydromonas aeria TaxID=2590212 RepID=UPI0012FBE8ED|nr:hypothetical protein [Azohydromonas aeria]